MGPLLQLLCNFIYQRSVSIVAQSAGMKRQLIERGVPAEKIAVVYNWADEQAAAPSGRCDLAPYRFKNRFNFVFGGNLGRVQGLDTLVRAAHLAGQQLPELQLLLIGNGIEADPLRALVTDLKADNVRIAPAVPREMIGDVFSAADVLVLHLLDDPLFEITIPSKTQFYLAMGKPILVGVNGEASKTVTEVGAGLAVPPQDVEAMAKAMVQMAHMRAEERAEMGRRGRAAYFGRFSFASAIAATEAVLREVVNARPGATSLSNVRREV
jgi:glycosyltransferase involved in cell wall biosynthesis